MMQLLPTETLDWVSPKNFNLDNNSSEIPIDSFLDLDLDYPDELNDLHNDYPLVGKKIKVKKEMLSDYQLQIIEHNNFFLGKNKKLFPNLGNKNIQTPLSKPETLLKFRATIKKNS